MDAPPSPLRILVVHQCFGALAGAEANVFISSEQLALRGHQVAILHGPPTGKGQAAWEQLFPTRYALPTEDVKRSVSLAVAQYQPDVIYVHKMADLDVLQALVDTGRPLVRMVHDHDIYCMRSYKYDYFSREICTRAAGPHCVFPCMACVVRDHEGPLPLKWVSYTEKKREIALNHQFDRMFVVTHYMREELEKNGFDPARICIFPPVPRPGDPDLRSSFSQRNLILYAGQIIRGKGVDALIESLALLKTPFECIILGDGSHKPACEKLVQKLGLQDRITFKGFIPQEELKAYYREASVVAISSLWPEPIATIGLEVFRYALPVVAFDAGGIKDWLIDGQTGRLVPWGDRQAYASALEQLLQDKALARRMGEAGLQLVSQQYDFAEYITRMETLFRQLAAEPRISAGARATPLPLAA